MNEILDLIYSCGGIDGSHHKQWVLDQIVRLITKDKYDKWVDNYEKLDDEGDVLYKWDIGIAP